MRSNAEGIRPSFYHNLSTGNAALADAFERIVGDLSDTDNLAQVLPQVEAVVRFAAGAYVGESVENPRRYSQNNLLGSLSLLNAVMASKVRKFIFTYAVYGCACQASDHGRNAAPAALRPTG